MRRLLPLLIVLIYFPCFASSNEQAMEFFKMYVELSDAFDVAAVEFYSDNARIHAYRVYPHGLERAMELTGSQWKQLAKRVMPLAKAKNDKNSFSNINIKEQGKGYKIKADRYSEMKCYIDKGYYMVVEPDNRGNLHIIEEYMETQPQSNC
jgi:hypothetical protein